MGMMIEQCQSCDLKDLAKKLLPEVMGQDMEKACSSIFPIKDCYIRERSRS